jgi:Rhs element Vgr protein
MESDYDFLSRLMEDEGIYYWFDTHENPGTMVLADNSSSAHHALPATDILRWRGGNTSEARFNEVTLWTSARRLDTGKYASRDSDFKAIRKKLGASINASDDHDLADFEEFGSAGGYFTTEAGENMSRTRGDELIARRDRHWAVTRWPDGSVGHRFKLEGDQDGSRDGEYLIGACTFAVTHPGYEGVSANLGSKSAMDVLRGMLGNEAVDGQTMDILEDIARNTPALSVGGRGTSAFVLTVMPAELPFRPARLAPHKLMPGPQSAIVVGPSGDEIHTDEFGRVKVHFHWDRYDESNEKSTCYVRVSQPWAGKGWGGYFIPRIGQEVIVDFLNGDPDRPIIVGRVYNDEQKIPYDSPTQSGFKTRSTPGGDSTNYNEIKFEDKKGSEVLNIHAEKDMSTSVENDDSTSVGHDQSLTVDHDRTARVRGKEEWTVEKNQTTSVVLSQTNTVNLVQTNIVKGAQVNSVGLGGQSTQVTGPQSNVFLGGQTSFVKGAQSITVDGPQTIAVTEGQKTTVTGDTVTMSSGELKIHAGSRKDLADGSFAIMAEAVKVVSNTDIEMMAVGSINATSMGSTTTILGSNSSGYIGINSQANLGMARSTFMGISMNNSLGMDISNFAGLQIENALALKMVGVGALELTGASMSIEQKGLELHISGGGAGAAAAAGVVGALGAFAGAYAAFIDVKATLKQYADARIALNLAAKEAAKEGLNGLAGRLSNLAAIAGRRSYVGGIVGDAAAAAAKAVGDAAAASAKRAGDKAGAAAKRVGDAAGAAAKAVGDAAGAAAKGVGDAAGAAAKAVGGDAAGAAAQGGGDAAGAAAKGVGDAAGGAAKGVGDAAGAAAKGYGDAAGGAAKGVGDAAGAAAKGVGEIVGGAPGTGPQTPDPVSGKPAPVDKNPELTKSSPAAPDKPKP